MARGCLQVAWISAIPQFAVTRFVIGVPVLPVDQVGENRTFFGQRSYAGWLNFLAAGRLVLGPVASISKKYCSVTLGSGTDAGVLCWK
jgi:hypothetical protein